MKKAGRSSLPVKVKWMKRYKSCTTRRQLHIPWFVMRNLEKASYSELIIMAS